MIDGKPVRKELNHLDTLKRRYNFLESRAMSSNKDLSWDKAEMSALRWAIDFIEEIFKGEE